VKHAHHAFQIDDDNTDSARHRRAGASQIAIVSARRYALVTELKSAPEPDFADVIAMLAPADLVIVEGYKSAPILKIEARRSAQLEKRPLQADDPLVIGLATDHPVAGAAVPVLDLDDVAGIAAFIADRVRLPPPGSAT
jgi:molybdopterin-guanine dinucleotide biosynthesis protein B